jgi:hypothetical protein
VRNMSEEADMWPNEQRSEAVELEGMYAWSEQTQRCGNCGAEPGQPCTWKGRPGGGNVGKEPWPFPYPRTHATRLRAADRLRWKLHPQQWPWRLNREPADV